MKRATSDRTTATAAVLALPETRGEAPSERAFLVVYPGDGGRTRVVPLGDGSEVVVGRLSTCTIAIEDDTISRRHARIVRRGPDITVEDLGSRNGTRVNGTRISAPTRLSAGDEVGIGPVSAILGLTTSMQRQTLVGAMSDFEVRLAAEADRAHRYRRALGLVMLRLEGNPDAVSEALEDLATSIRTMDLLAEYGADEYALLLPEADGDATGATARRLVAAAARHRVSAQAGMAVYPRDGARPGELVTRARAALRAARTGGGRGGVSSAPTETLHEDGDVVVADPVMKRVFALARKVAAAPMTVLIVGETGVGKEIVAESIHRHSPRGRKPFVKLNCASLPDTLLESELFGHERGAFTGADRQKIGYFEAARGGTIFLDEIGELPPGAQAKLLRVLEARTITRLGGTQEVPVDVRIVCATNRDLEAEVKRGRFREDLFFRVSAFLLAVPPLRNRRAEIGLMAAQFARQFARELGQPPPALAPEAQRALEAYHWPGNVRELRNAIERAVVLHPGGRIQTDHLPDRVVQGDGSASGGEEGIRQKVASVERGAVVAALEAEGGNQTRAARRLGISRFALIRLMEKYGLKRPRPSR